MDRLEGGHSPVTLTSLPYYLTGCLTEWRVLVRLPAEGPAHLTTPMVASHTGMLVTCEVDLDAEDARHLSFSCFEEKTVLMAAPALWP